MALLTGLLLMAAVSVLALTAAGSMTMQQRLAANYEDKARAAAESELAGSWALAWLYTLSDTDRQPGCTASCLLPLGIHDNEDIPDSPEFESLAWWRANGTRAGTHPVTGEFVGFAASAPSSALWIMEELHFEPAPAAEGETSTGGIGYYRVFSRGRGKHPRSVVITEAIVARPWGYDAEPAAFPPDQPMAAFCDQLAADVPCGTLAWRRRL